MMAEGTHQTPAEEAHSELLQSLLLVPPPR